MTSILDMSNVPYQTTISSSNAFCLYFPTGMILMNMRYSAERESVASLLAPRIVDPENAYSHLLPYLACEHTKVQRNILNRITSPTN